MDNSVINIAEQGAKCDAWNPGISSKIPTSLQPLITLFRDEVSSVGYQQIKELSDCFGLKEAELIAFRPERLVIHELLIRVTSDLSVPDGPNYEDLGINLRSMVSTIFHKFALPEMPTIDQAFTDEMSRANEYINSQLAEQIFERASESDNTTAKASWLGQLFGRNTKTSTRSVPTEPVEMQALLQWRKLSETETDPSRQYCLSALIKVVSAMVGHRGRLLNEPELIAKICTNTAGNLIGAEVVAKLIDPVFRKAVETQKYRVLPTQKKPVVLNVKGASAAGKSTIRPKQRELVDELGIAFEDFALISPDYWRKFLLDYDSLGDDHKYAAMLTGQELEIIDKKLDRYMTEKADKEGISHLLIDRFRFDSFNVGKGQSNGSKLLSRFGDQIFMFFVVTPPKETVVRAWERGKSTGRYKAVDDLLYHNVEAFTGMPALFLSWVKSTNKHVHFEFLDNDVPKDQRPKTAAFGWNNSMTILDIKLMLNIDLYRKINVEATNADEVLSKNKGTKFIVNEFLKHCIEKIDEVKFAEADTAKVYVQFQKGKVVWCDKGCLEKQADAQIVKELFFSLGYSMERDDTDPTLVSEVDVAKERKYTLGAWYE